MVQSNANPRLAQHGMAILRVATGLVFLLHGYQKFFSMGIAGVTGFFSKIGIPAPNIAAPFVSGLELVGGALLILGLFTRPIALLLAINMLVAILTVHLSSGFFVSNNGYEFALTLMAACLALAFGGGGSLSADEVRRDKVGR
jgi:putative oxidoreductase